MSEASMGEAKWPSTRPAHPLKVQVSMTRRCEARGEKWIVVRAEVTAASRVEARHSARAVVTDDDEQADTPPSWGDASDDGGDSDASSSGGFSAVPRVVVLAEVSLRCLDAAGLLHLKRSPFAAGPSFTPEFLARGGVALDQLSAAKRWAQIDLEDEDAEKWETNGAVRRTNQPVDTDPEGPPPPLLPWDEKTQLCRKRPLDEAVNGMGAIVGRPRT
mmetsp:Transcript_5785/g.13379  ORF Transcript_5785/g.13379 Transcript_5785/m.13379 type:complete len:217 (-) Transcript_5785:202-852(-)